MIDANGDYISYSYDALNRLISEVKKKQVPSSRNYYSYVYQFDPVGNQVSFGEKVTPEGGMC